MRVLNAVKVKLHPKSTSSKLTRSARPLINRPISKVNAIIVRATTKVKVGTDNLHAVLGNPPKVGLA